MYKNSLISNVDLKLSDSLYNKFHSDNALITFPSLMLIDSYQYELEFNFPVNTNLYRIPVSLLNSNNNSFQFNGGAVQKFSFLHSVCVANNLPFYIDNDYFYLLDSSTTPLFVFTGNSASPEVLNDIIYLNMLKIAPVISNYGNRIVNIQDYSTIFYCNAITFIEPFEYVPSMIKYFDFSCSYKVPKSLSFPL